MSLRHRNFVFTRNNPGDINIEDYPPNRYICYGLEVAPTTGTSHHQGVISFEHGRSVEAVRKSMKGCHVDVMFGTIDQAIEYCQKEGLADFCEKGVRPMSNDNKGRAELVRWHKIKELAKAGRLDEIDSKVYVLHYATLNRIAKDHMIKALPKECKAYWIWGATGTGKSHCVESMFPDCYKKDMTSFFMDGYQDEDTVYIEDIDKFQVKWGGFLKRIADKWPMMASIKQSMRYIRPLRVVVTSNYHPEQIWVDDLNTTEPIMRRFKVIQKMSQEQEIDWS